METKKPYYLSPAVVQAVAPAVSFAANETKPSWTICQFVINCGFMLTVTVTGCLCKSECHSRSCTLLHDPLSLFC